MKSKRHLTLIFLILSMMLLLSGCSFPLNTDTASNDSALSHIPYENTASSTSEILDHLMDTMSKNQTTCELFIRDKSLIDADLWLTSLSGIEEIHCGYKKVSSGYNILVTLQYWDNYPIVYAYQNNDTSTLNEKQLELYQKYMDVLAQTTSDKQTDYQNELAIHDYIVSNFSYVNQPDTRYNAYQALINGEGVCSGYTECFKTFMDLLGIENNTISGESSGERHIWNEVKLDNEWYQVDVTWDDPINGNNQNIDHSYFNITDADMELDHTWDSNQTDYQPANGIQYCYANIMGLLSIENQTQLNHFLSNCIEKRSTYIEFQSNQSLDIKSAMSVSNVTLSYSYKIVERVNYSLYTITFSYE